MSGDGLRAEVERLCERAVWASFYEDDTPVVSVAFLRAALDRFIPDVPSEDTSRAQR